VASGLGRNVGHLAGILFAIALIDASIIGAAAVGLSTSYALGDLFGLKHSLHRKFSEAKSFYAIFAGLLAMAAVIVIIPGSPLGLITEGVQALAGVLLPSATLFLLLLCNDRQVLGPWVNGRLLNLFTGFVITILGMLSWCSLQPWSYPTSLPGRSCILGASSTVAALGGVGVLLLRRWEGRRISAADAPVRPAPPATQRGTWRMPALSLLDPPVLTMRYRLGLGLLATYMITAAVLVVVRIVQLAIGQ
jgi:hypothetical protein